MTIVKCDSLRLGDGHYCIYDEILKKALISRTSFIATFSHAGSISVLPKALTSGNIIQAVNTEASQGTVLPYGGLLLSSNGPTLVFDENWSRQTQNVVNLKPYTLTVLSNNTVIFLEKLEGNGQPGDWMIWKGWKATLANVSKNIQQSKYNDNPIIKSTSPTLGREIPLNTDSIKITFTREDFRLGFGNISIYAAEYPQYPRQFITVVPGYSNIGPSYETPVSRYAFNTPNTDYYVTVDGGAFHSKIDEPLMGVKTGVWFFKTAAKTQPNENSDTVLQIRISNDVSEDSNAVASLLKNELSQILPVESERISVRRLRSDGDAGDIYQVTLKRLHGNGKQTAANLALDFQSMLTNKVTSGLQLGSTTRSIDSEFGVIIEENVFSSNKWVFTGILCGGVVFLILFGVMHRRYPDSNNLMILMLVISLFDFVSDLFFVVMNSGDVPSLRVPSIIFFVIPFAFNMIASTGIIVKEVSTNPYFHEWFTRRTLVTSAVSVLSATNPYLLNLLSSKIGGMSDLDAPMSGKVSKWILYCTAIDIIIEDIPQLVIQTLYKTHNGYFKLAPLLSLVSSCLGIILAIISNVFTYIAHKNPPKNIARKGTDFKGSHFQINETIEQVKYI
ncbi:hypothetical protein K7432_013892 [Basidiobolus ranarum]|uniref:Uncharacterized protein n=1 Tax=Basidiobolus ranarum TaxID=34480 RepID=A0ABR2WII9_9FUNG